MLRICLSLEGSPSFSLYKKLLPSEKSILVIFTVFLILFDFSRKLPLQI